MSVPTRMSDRLVRSDDRIPDLSTISFHLNGCRYPRFSIRVRGVATTCAPPRPAAREATAVTLERYWDKRLAPPCRVRTARKRPNMTWTASCWCRPCGCRSGTPERRWSAPQGLWKPQESAGHGHDARTMGGRRQTSKSDHVSGLFDFATYSDHPVLARYVCDAITGWNGNLGEIEFVSLTEGLGDLRQFPDLLDDPGFWRPRHGQSFRSPHRVFLEELPHQVIG